MPGTCVCARADFERALDALIENAIQYSPRGLRDHDRRRRPGASRCWTAGPASRPARRRRSSSASIAAAPAPGPKGTGLGLSIARELAGEWGGSVRLENREGGGVRAVLELPRIPVAASPDREAL